MSAEQRIKDLGLVLPSGSAPAANYTSAVRSGNLQFIAGKAPLPDNGKLPKGRLRREYTAEEAYRFARSVLGASFLRGGPPIFLKAVVEVAA